MIQKRGTLSLVLLFMVMVSCTDTSFNENRWKNWDGKESFVRWDMADDLINNMNIIGKSQNEIKSLLGNPDKRHNCSVDNFYYNLGPCRRGIDFGSLYVKFKNGRVDKIEKCCN